MDNTTKAHTMNNTHIMETMEQAMARACPDTLALLAEPDLVLGMGGDTQHSGDVMATASVDTQGTREPTTRIGAQWLAMEYAHAKQVRYTAAWRSGFNADKYMAAQAAVHKAAHKAAFPYLYASNGTLRNLNTRKYKSVRATVLAEAATLANAS
jgi:hypothetical protein